MDKKPFQYSLYSLLMLTTACAVLMSLVKTFPNASAHLAGLGLMSAGPLLFFLGSLLVFHGEVSNNLPGIHNHDSGPDGVDGSQDDIGKWK